MVFDGRIRAGNESVDDAAKRVLAELTGLENVYMEQVGTFGAVDRDPGERVISVAYYALVNVNEYDRKLVRKHNAYWVNINELPPLIFDHPAMVTKARELMRQKASTEPIGFNLLPKLFTLSKLQSLYEAIYGETMDKRNFRKRVAGMDYVEKTDKIDKLCSKRGAALYKFNSKVYRKDPEIQIIINMLEELKEKVFHANLELVKHGLVIFTWGNVSAIDRESGLVVIKPSGVSYDEMKAEDMVVVDLDGKVVEGRLKPSSRYSDSRSTLQSIPGNRRSGTYPLYLCDRLGASRMRHSEHRNYSCRLFPRRYPLHGRHDRSRSERCLRTGNRERDREAF